MKYNKLFEVYNQPLNEGKLQDFKNKIIKEIKRIQKEGYKKYKVRVGNEKDIKIAFEWMIKNHSYKLPYFMPYWIVSNLTDGRIRFVMYPVGRSAPWDYEPDVHFIDRNGNDAKPFGVEKSYDPWISNDEDIKLDWSSGEGVPSDKDVSIWDSGLSKKIQSYGEKLAREWGKKNVN